MLESSGLLIFRGALKSLIRPMRLVLGYIPFSREWRRRVFLRKVYMPHIRAEHSYIFASIARFCVANRPING